MNSLHFNKLPGPQLCNKFLLQRFHLWFPISSHVWLPFTNKNTWFWPLTFIDTEACKIPHRFQMGDVVSVQNLRQNQGVLDRLTSEFDAWSLSFDLQALSVNFQFEFDAVKIL